MKNSKQKEVASGRNLDFDILRIVSIIAVVFLHESAGNLYQDVPTFTWEISNVQDAAVRWGVPVFVMISGALFLNPEKKVGLWKLYSKNIFRLVCAYVIWSIIYQLWFLHDHEFDASGFVFGIINGWYHMWFLKMLVGIYVAIPILRQIVSNKQTEQYFLVLAFVTSFVIPKFIGLTTHIHVAIHDTLQSFYDTMSINIAMGYTGYFVLGHYLSTYPLNSKQKRLVVIAAVISYLIVVVATSGNFHISGIHSEKLYGNLNPFTLVEAVAIYSLFQGMGSRDFFVRKQSLVLQLSKWSFGVYLIHPLVMSVLRDYFGIDINLFNPIFSVPILTVLVFVLSNTVVYLLHHIPIIRSKAL